MVMRIGGLASGMDIDDLVAKLMKAERAPLNKLFQNKQTYEWQRDAYRDVNKKLKTFDTYVADNLVLKNMTTKTVNNSNSNLVSATALGSATGSLSIESVEQLATAGRIVGGQIDATATGNSKLADLGISGTLKIVAPNSNADDIQEIEINADMTMNDLVKKINNSNSGVSAVFESGKLSITSKETGAGAITVTGTATDALKLGTEGVATQGQNAIFTVNGIRTERSSNSFSINGYNGTLKSTFDSTQAVTLSSSTNVDDMVNKIKEFVNTYNGLVKDLKDQTNQTKYRDYKPLTAEQKEEMSENEIKLWEEKAKSGLLRNDSLISDGLSKMRTLVYEANPGLEDSQFKTLFSVGITTTKNYNDGGTLEIDEKKLREALEKDPDAVERLFKNADGKKNDVVDGKSVDTRGYLDKLRDSIKGFEQSIEKKAGRATSTNESQYSLGKSIKDIDDRIKTWQDKLKMVEARYWKQFGAMEAAINKANQQSGMLFSGQQQ